MNASEVLARRRAFWKHGYRPLAVWNPDQRVNDEGEPLKNPGKQPRGTWRIDAGRDPPVAVRIEPDTRALNTGILCQEVVGFDIDVVDCDLVEQLVALIERALGASPLVRIGRAPKTLLVYRPDQPFRKLQTPELFFADGAKAKVELLADGQQFVADGIHPDTGKPYRWTDRTPADVPLEELPFVTEEQARAVIAEAEQILRAAGAREKEKPQPKPRKPNGHAGDFFHQVNTAALADIAAWARSLFLRARFEPGTGAWRISSKDLGRDLEEDISIHPDGIRDFGEEVRRSPIDVVIRYGAGIGTTVEAALWLCERLAIDPASLGFHRKQQQANGGDADPPLEFDKRAGPQPSSDDDQTTGNPWAEPPPAEPEWPEIDPEAFHGLAGEIVEAIAPLTEADPVALLAQQLATFGSAFGRHAFYRVGNTKQYPNLYEIIVGQTAKGRKGTSYDSVEDVLQLADQTWVDNCVKSGLSSGEGIIHSVHDGIWVREKVTHGRGAKPTYERVLKEEPVADKRLFIIEPEFASALTVMKRQGNTLGAVLRLAWDGKRLQTIVKHNAEKATGVHVTVIGHITIEELRVLLDRVAIASGLANRFLLILAKRANVLPFPGWLDRQVAQRLADRLHDIFTTMEWRRAEVIFSPEARDLWIAEYPTLSAAQPGLFGFAIGRAEAQTLRLAMIYALLDKSFLIEPAHLRAALAF